MQTIGLIGGITPQSTIMYYELLNQLAVDKFGSKHSCKVIINSLDFGEVSRLQSEGRWDLLDDIMVEAAKSLKNAGASIVVICANTMHLCVDAIKKNVEIPIIHIAKATVKQIQNKRIKKVALLGTKYTMEKPFFRNILNSNDIDVIVPNENERQIVHDVIYDELSKGLLLDSSKRAYLKIIESLTLRGANGIILGCTEIPLLVGQTDVQVPVFDTTTIHAKAAFSEVNKMAIKNEC
jgi:aspartate racemase